jgi:DNA-binding MarR family transcriptional regulator
MDTEKPISQTMPTTGPPYGERQTVQVGDSFVEKASMPWAAGSPHLEREVDDALEVRLALHHFLRRTREECERHGLTAQLYQLLLVVAASNTEGRAVSELASLLEVGQPAASELVGRGIKAGLLMRSQVSDDRRRARLWLTRDGEARLCGTFDALRGDRRTLSSAVARVAGRAG